jgi:hypothetical protein
LLNKGPELEMGTKSSEEESVVKTDGSKEISKGFDGSAGRCIAENEAEEREFTVRVNQNDDQERLGDEEGRDKAEDEQALVWIFFSNLGFHWFWGKPFFFFLFLIWVGFQGVGHDYSGEK